MLSKQALLPKRSLGSPPGSTAGIKFTFGSRDIIKGHSKQSSQTFHQSTTFPSLNGSLQKLPSTMHDSKFNALMKDVLEARETLKENKTAILNELPAFRDSLKQEMQDIMLYFVDNVRAARENQARELQIYIDTLQNQIGEKEIVNQNLLETNKVLAQKNEALSNMLVTTTSQLSIANAKEVPLDAPEEPMKYTQLHSKKLMHENRNISQHLAKSQTLNPYSSKRIKAQVGQLREYAVRSHRDKSPDGPVSAVNEEKANEASGLGKLLAVESVKNLCRHSPEPKEGETGIGDEQAELIWRVMQGLVEDLEMYKKAALEENEKYVEAMKGLEEAAKEKRDFVSLVRKYDQLVSENEDTIRSSRRAIKELNMMVMDMQRNCSGELEEEYRLAREMWEKKEEMLVREKEVMERQLENVKSELSTVMGDIKKMSPRKKSSPLKVREKSKSTGKGPSRKASKADSSDKDKEIEMIRKELEMVQLEKASYEEKLHVHDENYENHLNMISELNSKIEELTGECELLRKANEKDGGETIWKMIVREKCMVESPEEFLVKYEDMEKVREELMSENKLLRSSLDELQAKLMDGESGSNVVLKNLEEEIVALGKEKMGLLLKCQESQLQASEALQEIRDKDLMISQYEAKLSELKTQLNEYIGMIGQIREQVALLEKEKSELAAQVKDGKGHGNHRLHDIARNSLNEIKIKELERKLEDSAENINQLKKQVAAVEKEKSELLDKLESNRVAHQGEVNESQEKIKSLENELRESLEAETQLESQIEELVAENKSHSESIQQLQNKINDMETKEGPNVTAKDVEELTVRLMHAEKEKEVLSKEIKAFKTEMSCMEVKVLEMDAAQTSWDESKKLLEDNMAIIKKEKQDLFKKNKEYQDVIEELKLQLSDSNQQRQGQRRQSAARRPSQGASSELEMLREKVKHAEEDYDEVCGEKEILEKLVKIERERSEGLEKKIMEVKEEYEGKIQEYRELLMEFQDDTDNHKDKEEDWVQKHTKLQAVCDDFEFKCEVLTREKEDLERDLVVCQEAKEEIQKELESYLGHPYKQESLGEYEGELEGEQEEF